MTTAIATAPRRRSLIRTVYVPPGVDDAIDAAPDEAPDTFVDTLSAELALTEHGAGFAQRLNRAERLHALRVGRAMGLPDSLIAQRLHMSWDSLRVLRAQEED